jgi:four helix bundle protein
MPDKLLIFQKTYDFTVWIYPHLNRIPKSHRLTIGRYTEESSLRILQYIIKANKQRTTEQRKILQFAISDELDILRIHIRLMKDLRFISVKQYIHTVDKLNEIGRMLQGWMKI